MNDLLYQTEQLTNSYFILLYLIVLGISATVIINTLIMSVFERTREIGILSAIGMKSGRIMAMFFAESSLLAVGGITIGLIVGAGLVAYATVYGFHIGSYGLNNIQLGDTIHAYMNMSDAVNLTILSFIVTILAALYPAILAGNMEPVQALRGGKQA
jgi:putative ABC transport system permease protein